MNQSALQGQIRQALGTINNKLDDLLQLADDIPTPPKEINLSYSWVPDLQDSGAFLASLNGNPAKMTLTTEIRKGLDSTQALAQAPTISINGSIRNFQLNLLPSESFVLVGFDEVSFRSVNGSSPDVTVKINSVQLGNALDFVRDLAKYLDPDTGPFLELGGIYVEAGFRFGLPAISTGAFNLLQLTLSASVKLPFDGSEVLARFAISKKDRPFLIVVGILGGGGSMSLAVGADGLRQVEGSLEFGATVALTIVGASGMAYVRAGIYFSKSPDAAELTGFVHAGGCLSIIGMIDVSLELYLGLNYMQQGDDSYVEGTASLQIEIDILFFSASVTVTMTKQFAGSHTSGPGSSRPNNLHDLRTGLQNLIQAKKASPLVADNDESPDYYTNEEWKNYCQEFAW